MTRKASASAPTKARRKVGGEDWTNLGLRIPAPEKAALVAAAQAERRSLSAYILNAGLERARELHGIPTPPPSVPPRAK